MGGKHKFRIRKDNAPSTMHLGMETGNSFLGPSSNALARSSRMHRATSQPLPKGDSLTHMLGSIRGFPRSFTVQMLKQGFWRSIKFLNVSLLHNYRGSGGPGRHSAADQVAAPDPVGARGVCTARGVAECRSWWPDGRRPRMAGRAVPSGAASVADGDAGTGGVRW